MRAFIGILGIVAMLAGPAPALAQDQPPPPGPGGPPPPPSPGPTYSAYEIVDAGHHFFGTVSRDLAMIVQHAASQWGLPNGYILGQEGGGAFIGGLRYGEGTLFTKNAGDLRVFWQGPSLGWDVGGDGARAMMTPLSVETRFSLLRS